MPDEGIQSSFELSCEVQVCMAAFQYSPGN